MDIQAEKLEIMKLLLEVDNPEILNEVKAIFKNKGYDFYNDLPLSVKESIEAGIKNIDEGKVYNHDWVMQDIKTKYGLKR